MKVSLKTKFIVSFAIVVVLTGLVATWIGIHLIGSGIVDQVQKKVKMDVNTAGEIYGCEVYRIRELVRLTACRFFIGKDVGLGNIEELAEKLKYIKEKEELDILTLTDNDGKVIIRTSNPDCIGDDQAEDEVIKKVINEKITVASTEIISREELLKEGKGLAEQAYIRIVTTPKAKKTEKDEQFEGMLIKAASPILNDNNEMIGILYGGLLLSRNYKIVDKIKNTVYKGEIYASKEIGTATIFQGDLRISTNVKNKDGSRAIGTRVSEEVSDQVLGKAKPWIARAFVVNDWYITAYKPIRNITGKVIGILYVGILEQKFVDLKRRTLLIFLSITTAGAVVSLIIAVLLSNGIIKPVKQLLSASKGLADGNLDFRVICNSNDELGDLAKAFNYMGNSIKERDLKLKEKAQKEIMQAERLAMIGRLSAGVAHEINNPLGSILLFTRLLLQKAPSDEVQRGNLERIEKDAKRCQNIIQGLLDFARQREPKIESVDINDLLDKTIGLFENHSSFHNIEVIKEYQSDVPPVIADSGQILQVFVNIIMNAIDAMEGDGILTISTRSFSSEDYVKISFTDTGCGISTEHLNQIFEPFFTTKGVGQGTGLGLSISYGIIKKHNGTIEVFSRVGEGSTFIVLLPKTKENT